MSQGYLEFPNIDPVLVSIGPLSIRWYGLMYLVGFAFALWLANRRADKPDSGWTRDQGGGPTEQAGVHLCVRPAHGRAGVAD